MLGSNRSSGQGRRLPTFVMMRRMTDSTQRARPNIGSLGQYLGLVSLLILYLLVALMHASLAPLTTGPDELAHYEYVRFISEHGRLPANTAERSQASYKSDQPPLYHLLAAMPASLVDPTGPPYLKRVGDHLRRQLIERTRHAWGLYNTEDELWPYRAEVLRWQVGRWVAILFGGATIAVTFFMARQVFALLPPPQRGRVREGVEPLPPRGRVGKEVWLLALGSAAVVAFIPRFALTGSMLNYETTLAFFAALFLWVMLIIAKGRTGRAAVTSKRMANGQGNNVSVTNGELITNPSPPPSPLSVPRLTFAAGLLGLLAGLSITAKLSALILPLEMLAALWLIKRAQGWSKREWVWAAIISVVATLATVSWWFGFIIAQFNTVARDGLWTGLLRPLIAADASDATTNRLLSFLTSGQAGFTAAIENLDSGPPWEWLAIFFRTFWVVGIEDYYPLGLVGLAAALAFCGVATYGLVQVWRQNDRRPIRQAQSRPLTAANTTADRRPQSHRSSSTQAASQKNIDDSLSALRSPLPALSAPRLILALLLLHLGAAFILPLLRYAATFSLADTAQGRHVLFQTAAAFAILLVWGLTEAVASRQSQVASRRSQVTDQSQPATRNTSDYSRPTPHASRSPFPASRLVPFLPGLFLLLWSGVQLWYMSWAYLPLLPVRTVPQAKAQAVHQLDRPFNDYITLAGYTQQLEDNGLLRIDLLWQATAVSPFDFLTEVSLIDDGGNLAAQWLGHPAGGRYPTRAWDVGDLVRDTVWLPVTGLEPGDYYLNLDLLPTARFSPFDPLPASADPPFRLTSVTAPVQTLPAADFAIRLWQDGRPVTAPQPFRYRETILVTLAPALADQPRRVQLTNSDGRLMFEPARDLGDSALFIVGPDWPTGDYHLRVTPENAGTQAQPIDSEPLIQVTDRWQRRFAPPEGGYVPLEANFANQVKLLGYTLGANRAEPGGGIPLTLYWQGLDWMGHNYTIFTRLLAADQTSHGGRDRLPQEGYSTLYWAPGEIVVDPFGVPVDVDAPAGVYYLNVGLYQEVNGQAVSLPLVQDGQPIETASVTIGPFKIGPTPPGWTVPAAKPQVSLTQPFGDAPNLTLLGYDLTGEANQPVQNSKLSPQNLKLTLYWRVESPLRLNYTTFVHLRNEAGEIVAQKDQLPLDGIYPTSLWEPGEIIADEVTLPLPPDLPAGMYWLVMGLYNFESGDRLSAPGQPEQAVTLTTLELTH